MCPLEGGSTHDGCGVNVVVPPPGGGVVNGGDVAPFCLVVDKGDGTLDIVTVSVISGVKVNVILVSAVVGVLVEVIGVVIG